MEVHEQGRLRLVKAGPLGPIANNAYLIQDKETGDTLLVDAPQDAETILSALDGGKVVRIFVTHRHQDHCLRCRSMLRSFASRCHHCLIRSFQ